MAYVETNLKEHFYSLPRFLITMTVTSVLGLVVGDVIDTFIVRLQDDKKHEQRGIWFFFILQILLNLLFFYLSIRVYRYADDWFNSTFAGYFFMYCLLLKQDTLTKNIVAIKLL